jgi:hypothetical protein
MEVNELLWIASVAIGKRYDRETLKYSDYMYGKESEIDDVWEYVEECDDIGRKAFNEKYSPYKLYPF